MKIKKGKHLFYYIFSIAILCIGLFLILINNHDNKMQALFIAMTATCYVLWSMVHHYVHHELHPRVVVEYLLIASLGIVLSLYLFNV